MCALKDQQLASIVSVAIALGEGRRCCRSSVDQAVAGRLSGRYVCHNLHGRKVDAPVCSFHAAMLTAEGDLFLFGGSEDHGKFVCSK